ncbi:MAG: substrate-binding domain-containing protein [Pseudomonadota bacterium]|nr:substrate-binding domain-containing protein [Pseudomonadota bacterium]
MHGGGLIGRAEQKGRRATVRTWKHGAGLVVAALALCLSQRPASAQEGDLNGALELVDPNVFRACADPRNLPFSDSAGEGFENKIAELFAKKLGKSVGYTFYPGATGFIRNTLNARRCDVVMGMPVGDDIVQPTNPYYRTAYVAVYAKDGPLAGLDALADPRLKTAKIGVIAGTPPVTYLAIDGLLTHIKSYALVVDTRYDSPNAEMVADLDNGVIDVALMWGPLAGYYAAKAKTPLTLQPLLKETGGPKLTYRIAMGVRHSDQNWKRDLNKLIAGNRDEIVAILRSYGVPLLDENDKPLGSP